MWYFNTWQCVWARAHDAMHMCMWVCLWFVVVSWCGVLVWCPGVCGGVCGGGGVWRIASSGGGVVVSKIWNFHLHGRQAGLCGKLL